jgi:hypothetical protein
LKIAEDDLEDLVKIGLVYEVNNEHKFSHQTYGEFGFNKFFARNFNDEDCAKFIVEVVLVDPSYRIIRSFTNFWILEKLDQKTFEIYTVKTDLINTCDTQEIKFSTATTAENFSKQIKCQIVSFPKKNKSDKNCVKMKK